MWKKDLVFSTNSEKNLKKLKKKLEVQIKLLPLQSQKKDLGKT
jgi:hypothetical protein